MAIGPGIKKVTTPALLRERWVRLVALTEGRVRDLVDLADVVSEGSVRDEGGTSTYYGSTSILIGSEALDGVPLDVFAHALRCDPHARLRIVRVASREATSRMPGSPAAVELEIGIEVSRGRIEISVDVVARLAARPSAIAE
jgi:hypothetical protein